MSLEIRKNDAFEPLEEGIYETDITAMREDTRHNTFTNTEDIGILVEFTLLDEGPMQGKTAFRFMNPTLSTKSTLTKLALAVMGREFTIEERASIQTLEDLQLFLVNKPVVIIIKNRASKNGKVYYNVTDFVRSKRSGVYSPNKSLPKPDETIEEPEETVDNSQIEAIFGDEDE